MAQRIKGLVAPSSALNVLHSRNQALLLYDGERLDMLTEI
jgi:hypothetical protein